MGLDLEPYSSRGGSRVKKAVTYTEPELGVKGSGLGWMVRLR